MAQLLRALMIFQRTWTFASHPCLVLTITQNSILWGYDTMFWTLRTAAHTWHTPLSLFLSPSPSLYLPKLMG